jgi:hypothetical protein
MSALPRHDATMPANVRAAPRRGGCARAFAIGMHGSSAVLGAMTDAKLDALQRAGRRVGYR